MSNYQTPPPGWYRNSYGQMQWWDGQAWGPLDHAVPSNFQGTSPSNPPGKGLALTGLLVACVAFLFGWVPVGGSVIAVVAIVFCIAALMKHQSKGMSIIGLSLAAVAGITSIIMIFVAGSFTQAFEKGWNDAASSESSEVTEAQEPPKQEEPQEVQIPTTECLTVAESANSNLEHHYATHKMYMEDAPLDPTPEESERWSAIVEDEEAQWQSIMKPLYSSCSGPADLYEALNEYPALAGFIRSDAFEADIIQWWCTADGYEDSRACTGWEEWIDAQ